MSIEQTIVMVMAGVMFGVAGLIGGWFIYFTEFLYPEKVLVKKKREGSIEMVYQYGKINTDRKTGIMTLKMTKEKKDKAIDKGYSAGITTGILGRKKRYWELYSPRLGEYHFVKTLEMNDTVKGQVTSQSDKLMYQNVLKMSQWLTEKPKSWVDYLPQIVNVAMPLIMVIAIVILLKSIKPELIASFQEAGRALVGSVSESLVNNPLPNAPPV